MSGIIVVTRAARAAIIKSEAAAAQSIKMLHKHAVRSTTDAIAAIRDDMQAAARGNDGAIPLTFSQGTAHYQVIAQIRASINHFGESIKPIIGQVIQHGTQSGASMAHAQLQASVPRGHTYTFALAHPDIAAQHRAALTYRLFDKYGNDAANAAIDAIREGVIAGRGPVVIARDLMSACDMSLVSALNTSRTESMYAMRSATLENYRANSDVVDAWIWYATLGTACAMCTAMHGTEHSLDEDMDSHNNCRCTQVPKTKSWADIFDGTGLDVSDIQDTTIEVQSGASWFADQSEAQQRDILGPAKYNAYKAGDITLADLVGKSNDKTWGASRYEKSLKDLDLDASDYLD
jgi:hypothetical protein